MGFFEGLRELIGLTMVCGVFTLVLYIPIGPFTAMIDGYHHPKAALVLAFIASIFIVNSLSEGIFLAALRTVVKHILIVGGTALVLGVIAVLAGYGDNHRDDD